jgi:hypothetical protein
VVRQLAQELIVPDVMNDPLSLRSGKAKLVVVGVNQALSDSLAGAECRRA